MALLGLFNIVIVPSSVLRLVATKVVGDLFATGQHDRLRAWYQKSLTLGLGVGAAVALLGVALARLVDGVLGTNNAWGVGLALVGFGVALATVPLQGAAPGLRQFGVMSAMMLSSAFVRITAGSLMLWQGSAPEARWAPRRWDYSLVTCSA